LHLAIVKQGGKKIQRFWGENLERNVVIFFFIILLFVLFDVLLYACIQRLWHRRKKRGITGGFSGNRNLPHTLALFSISNNK
jgi:hypothetical protein